MIAITHGVPNNYIINSIFSTNASFGERQNWPKNNY